MHKNGSSVEPKNPNAITLAQSKDKTTQKYDTILQPRGKPDQLEKICQRTYGAINLFEIKLEMEQ